MPKYFWKISVKINTYGAYCILYDKNMRQENPHKFRPEDQIKTGEQENRIFRPENQRTIKTGEQENNSERKNIESRNMAL